MRGSAIEYSDNHTTVLVPVSMAQENEAVSTLLRVCATDTKKTITNLKFFNFFRNLISVAHFNQIFAKINYTG